MASMMLPTGLLAALTPFILPSKLFSEIGRFSAYKTGIIKLDHYLESWNRNRELSLDTEPDVLLVEDDLVCATPVLKFCSKFKLKCLHVESLGKALLEFERWNNNLRLVILDNFVRVEAGQERGCKTGIDWLQKLDIQYPKDKRHFSIIIISGHTLLLGDEGQKADLVLQKPWEPAELYNFMKKQGIL